MKITDLSGPAPAATLFSFGWSEQSGFSLSITRPKAIPRSSISLLQADGPERILEPASLGVLNQRKPGCLATLCTREFLGRYGGAIYRPTEPADDNQDIAHTNLHGHAQQLRVRLRCDLLLLLAKGVRGQGVPIFMIGLISCVADQCGLLRLDTPPGGLYLGVRRALAASPRLSSGRRVSGDVIPDESAGSATDRSTCFAGGGRGRRNREISTEENMRRTGVA